jgi:hypothetical protein
MCVTIRRADELATAEAGRGPRPSEYDRGQKKGHTIKNLRVIDEAWYVCFLSETSEGNAHDKSLANLAGDTLPAGSCLYQDLGCQGFVPAGVTIVQPKQKPRAGDLTQPEKATNRRISPISIRIEQPIGGVKRSSIVKDKIHLLKDGIRDTIQCSSRLPICCARAIRLTSR